MKGYKGLTEIIPEGVTIIDKNAFKGCKTLQIVTLPSSLKVIGEFVFSECESLVEIIIPRNVTIIEKMHLVVAQICEELFSQVLSGNR